MKLISVRAAIIPNRVMVEFDSGLRLPLLVDDVVVLKLVRDQEIDDTLFKQIVYKSVYYLLRNSALIQINNSPKTEKLLSQKLSLSLSKILAKYQYPQNIIKYSDIIADLVSFFKEKGLLNDADFVQYYIRKNHSKSRMYLEQMLQSYGINRSQITKYLPPQASQKEEVLRILRKKNISATDLKDYNIKNKLTASFFRKGFTFSDIKSSFDDLLNNR